MVTTSPDTLKSFYPISASNETLDKLGNQAKSTVERFNNALTTYNNTHEGVDVPLLEIDNTGDIDNKSRDATLKALASLAKVTPEQLTMTMGGEDGIPPKDADTPEEKLAVAAGHIAAADVTRDFIGMNPAYDPNKPRKLGQPSPALVERRLERAGEILNQL